MKSLFLVLALISANSSFASITDSKYEERHQLAIEEAILSSCGHFRDLVQVEAREEVIVVDQGIHDVKFKTILSGLQRLDQNIFDRYTITVESQYADMYDHESKNWGVYSVDSVFCQMQ